MSHDWRCKCVVGNSLFTDDDVQLEDGEKVYDDEKEGVAYNYSFFHLMLFLASLYIMMVLTHWYK